MLRDSLIGSDLVARKHDKAIVTVWSIGDRKVRVRCWPQDEKPASPAVLSPRHARELAAALLQWADAAEREGRENG